jgi:hypothetical protein
MMRTARKGDEKIKNGDCQLNLLCPPLSPNNPLTPLPPIKGESKGDSGKLKWIVFHGGISGKGGRNQIKTA